MVKNDVGSVDVGMVASCWPLDAIYADTDEKPTGQHYY